MERRKLTIPDRPPLKRFVRALPLALGWLALLAILVRVTSPLTWIILILVTIVIFAVLAGWSNGPTRSELLALPCSQCGKTPMRFDRGSEGDYVFICDQCQIEWTLPTTQG